MSPFCKLYVVDREVESITGGPGRGSELSGRTENLRNHAGVTNAKLRALSCEIWFNAKSAALDRLMA